MPLRINTEIIFRFKRTFEWKRGDILTERIHLADAEFWITPKSNKKKKKLFVYCTVLCDVNIKQWPKSEEATLK